LVHNVIGRMFMTKLKTTAVWLLVIAAGGYGLSLAAPQSGGKGRGQHDASAHPEAAKSKAQPPINPMGQYVVEPPDILRIEVFDALPGRPITGERVVWPDGRISLEFYGDLYVAGLTLPEIKKKLILHLRTYLKDQQLGLTKGELLTGEPLIDRATGKPMMIDPKDSLRVSVDLKASNSKHYYLQGAVVIPGRAPITGNETVLDAVNLVNGLTPDADHNQVYLYRPDGKGGPVRALKIDIDQIMLGDDLSTNYQLIPGDRLVVRPRAGNLAETEESPAKPSGAIAPQQRRLDVDSDRPKATDDPSRRAAPGGVVETLQGLDKRLGEVERKLNLILEALKSAQR
jgi:polysaccharide export outer membrane protein